MPRVRVAGFSVSLDGFPAKQSAPDRVFFTPHPLSYFHLTFFFFGRMTLIATASSEVLMCEA
jgi:hypothetical protein